MSGLERLVVVGSSGSGKTTVARALADLLGHPLLEMDSVRHRDGWDSVGGEEFSAIVSEFARQDRWVIDGNYTSLGTRDVVWPRADTVVWLDVPKRVVMTRVIWRTLRRMLTRERLWGGLREPLSNLYKRDPYQNIVVWAWTRFEGVRAKYETAMTDGSWRHATVHRLRTPGEVSRFLAGLADRSGREIP
jgi:adenylate kinase family enzyme